MSNANLIDRLRKSIDGYRLGNTSLLDLLQQIEIWSDAFEKINYPLFKIFQSIVHYFKVQAWYIEEGCSVDTEIQKLVSELMALLDTLPK